MPQVVWCNRELCSLQQANPSLRDGYEGQGKCLPPGLLRMPALQSEVSGPNFCSFLISVLIQIAGQDSKALYTVTMYCSSVQDAQKGTIATHHDAQD